jgi:peptide-methionine (R)-S-oxide reductase
MSDGDNTDFSKLTDEQWRERLTPEQFQILREKGTERAFTGALYDNHAPGLYRCAACGNELFRSEHKFDSGTGWPSFDRPTETMAVRTEVDRSLGMHRIEVVCANCGSHLGHVFPDGPQETTGQRFCINSAALAFEGSEDG